MRQDEVSIGIKINGTLLIPINPHQSPLPINQTSPAIEQQFRTTIFIWLHIRIYTNTNSTL